MTLKLKPDFLDAVTARAEAEGCLGQNDAALADMSMIASTKPSGSVYFDIGILQWRMANFAAAADSFQKAVIRSPDQPYYLLWLGIMQARNGNFDAKAFAKYSLAAPAADGPNPIFDLFLGKTTLAAVFALAAKANAQDVAGHTCEADFYGGEWQLAYSAAPANKFLFQDAVKICPRNFGEFLSAQFELKRLQ